MDSWLNRGAGFHSTHTEVNSCSQVMSGDSKICHRSDSPRNKRRKSDWKREEFLSSFSLHEMETVSSPDNGEIDWSESSSDNEEKVNIKCELTNKESVDRTNQGKNHIRKKIYHRKRKQKGENINVQGIPLSRKELFINNIRKGGFCVSNSTPDIPCTSSNVRLSDESDGPSICTPSTPNENLPEFYLHSRTLETKNNNVNACAVKKSINQSFSNKWTCSSFGSQTGLFTEKKTGANKTRRHKKSYADKFLCLGGNSGSPQPDIEECMSSSGDSVDDIEDVDDDGDDDEIDGDGKKKEKNIHAMINEDCSESERCAENPCHTLPRNTLEIPCVEYIKHDIICQEPPTSTNPDAHSIRLIESPSSGGSQFQINGTSTSSESNKSSQKLGASDWASIFQRQVSPPRDNQACPVTEDSGKKKRKFASKSMTGQLVRLVSREKTSVRFWHHSVNAGTAIEKPRKFVIVQVISMARQFSFYVCQCKVLQSLPSLSSACEVLLSRNTVDGLKLKPGMNIQIYPPWQQLDEGKNITLMCTNYIQALTNDDLLSLDHQSLSSSPRTSSPCITTACLSQEESSITKLQERHLHLSWTCPCSLNENVSVSSCPASKPDCNPLVQVPQSSVLSPKNFTLHSITSSVPIPNSPSGLQRTLLESIEEGHKDGECLPPFGAVILRAFRVKSEEEDKVSLVVLLEDSSGTLAVVTHCEEAFEMAVDDSTFSTLMKKERKLCLCKGLSVQARISKERDPSLFSVISQCWLRRKPILESQDNPIQESHNLQLKVPSFCYLLQQSSRQLLSFDSADEREPPVKIDLMGLQKVSEECLPHRFSALVILMNLQNISRHVKGSHLLLFDPHPSSTYSTLHQLIIMEDCMNIWRQCRGPLMSTCLLRDALMKNGMVCCDKYSSLFDQSYWTTLGIEESLDESSLQTVRSYSLRLSPLPCNAQPGDIHSVEGIISLVDEEASFSWESCDKCGQEISHSSCHSRVFCTSCHQPVEKTISKMTMNIELCVKNFPSDIIVKLNLNQATIHLILPNEMDEEGYEVEQVLGRNITADVCVVLNKTENVFTLTQLEI